MMEKSVLELVGGEKHINPHYDIKAENTSCYPVGEGFTGIEINGVRFSNISEMLQYVDKQREHITNLEKENVALREQNKELLESCEGATMMYKDLQKANDNLTKAKEIIKNLVEFDSSYKDDEEYQRKSELYDKMWEEAEQFLK